MPRRPRASSDLTILIAAGSITLLLCVASFLLAPVDSTTYRDGSSYSPRPGGAKAAFVMLRETGYHIDRSFEPLTAIRSRPQATVLILANPARSPSQQDVRALERFLAAGGIVVATDAAGAEFLPGLPGRGSRSASSAQPAPVPAAIVSPVTAGVPDVEMPTASAPVPPDSPYVVVYGSDRSPAIVLARVGEGMALWWADSRPLTNGAIRRSGHAELLLNIAGPPGERAILWDEHYHGLSRSFWSYLAATPLGFSSLQLGVIAAAALFTWSRRKWPIRALHVEPRTSPLEFVESMGALYQRAGVACSAVATVRARVRRALLATTRLPASTDDDTLADAVGQRRPIAAATVERVLRESADAARSADLGSTEAAAIVSRLQELTANLAAPRSIPAAGRRAAD
jgi:hypothetical protein